MTIAVAAINLVLGWVIYRMNRAQDAKDARSERLEARVSAIELNIAGGLMTKEDAVQLEAQLDKLATTLGIVKDMVLRLDEREKVRHSQG